MLKKIARQNIEIDKNIQGNIQNDSVYFLKKNLGFSLPANLICALFIFLILFKETPSSWLFPWFLSVLLVSLFRCFIFSNFASWTTARAKLFNTCNRVVWHLVGNTRLIINALSFFRPKNNYYHYS